MYIIGYIQTNNPRVLINPVSCSSPEDLLTAINQFASTGDYEFDEPISIERLEYALKERTPLRINFTGFKVALLLGETDIIHQVTDTLKDLLPE